VHLAVPPDVASQPAPRLPEPAGRFGASAAPEAIRTVHELLATAQHPVLLVGSGVLHAEASRELLAFAERTNIPVATSPKSRGVFPESHALALGSSGYGISSATERLLTSGKVDVLFAVGTSLGESATNLDARLCPTRAFVHVDLAPIADRWPITHAIRGDAKSFFTQLLARDDLPRFDVPLEARVRPSPPRELGHPALVIDALERVRGRQEVVVSDAGNCFWWIADRATFDAPRTFLMNLGAGSMGYAIGAAIGASLGNRRARTWSVIGDAAFLMSPGDVHVAVEERLPIVWIVLNDGGHAMVTHGYAMAFGAQCSPTRFTERIDVVGLARSLGATGISTTTRDIESALLKAREVEGPVAVDVEVDPAFVPESFVRRMDRFKKLHGLRGAGADHV
jgi:acetolactate synthase-1/2/3 large subunit